MKVNTNDYVIINNAKNKKLVVLVTNVDEMVMKGVVDNKDRANEATAEEVSFEKTDIFCNLGKFPKAGSVYGQVVEPWFKNKQIRPWASVNTYLDLNDTELKAVFDTLKTCGQVAQQRGLVSPTPIDVEVRPPKGKYDGMYHYRPKEDASDLMVLRPKEYTSDRLPYVIYHELGHSVWYRLLTSDLRNSWTELFITSSIIREITKADMKGYKDTLLESGTCKAFLSKAEDDDERLVLNEIFKYIFTRHKVDKRVINELLAAEQFEQIEQIFPSHNTFVGKKEELLSPYSATKVEELFAEAVAYHMTEVEMPKSIRILLKKTFKEIGV
jgi:hypothetical protein